MKALRYFIIILSFNVYAGDQEKTFGDWKIGSFRSDRAVVSYANTTNESGSTLGVLCLSNSDSCTPYIVNGLTCEKDGVYPALVAIDNGVEAIEMGCVHIKDRHLYTLPANHLEFMVTMNRYSVAFGTAGGKFKAAYFSLNGSAKAVIAAKQIIDAAKTLPEDKNKSKNPEYQDTYL